VGQYQLVGAADPTEAAALTWIALEGIRRVEYLTRLNTPKFILEAQVDAYQVAQDLHSLTDEQGPCWVLDNQVEAWLFVVTPISGLPAEQE
jgi:hypothetical protein